ncbi:hypothetical protein NL676_016303 [Syzygium grande]|nr:hypothetical protein NL676_016303 [Syzygium grande]
MGKMGECKRRFDVVSSSQYLLLNVQRHLLPQMTPALCQPRRCPGYATSAYSYLTGRPCVLLTVSGSGCVHGLAGPMARLAKEVMGMPMTPNIRSMPNRSRDFTARALPSFPGRGSGRVRAQVCQGKWEVLEGDAKRVLELITKEIKDDPFCLGRSRPWVEAISKKTEEKVSRMEAQLAKEVVPFNFLTPMKIISDAILGQRSPAPILVSEGGKYGAHWEGSVSSDRAKDSIVCWDVGDHGSWGWLIALQLLWLPLTGAWSLLKVIMGLGSVQ